MNLARFTGRLAVSVLGVLALIMAIGFAPGPVPRLAEYR